MTTTTRNEAAERLRKHLALPRLQSSPYQRDLDEALAAERRATVEEMEREGVVTWADDRHRERFFLDEEAAR